MHDINCFECYTLQRHVTPTFAKVFLNIKYTHVTKYRLHNPSSPPEIYSDTSIHDSRWGPDKDQWITENDISRSDRSRLHLSSPETNRS
jgi:hypothetical protein